MATRQSEVSGHRSATAAAVHLWKALLVHDGGITQGESGLEIDTRATPRDVADLRFVALGAAVVTGEVTWRVATTVATPFVRFSRSVFGVLVQLDRGGPNVVGHLERRGAATWQRGADTASASVGPLLDRGAHAAIEAVDLDALIEQVIGELSPEVLRGLIGEVLGALDPHSIIPLVESVVGEIPPEPFDPLVDKIMRRVDAETIAVMVHAILGALDLDEVVALALDGIDLDATLQVALTKVDLDAVIATALGSMDLDAMAAGGLDEVDLQRLTLELIDRLDLAPVVDAALETLDVPDLVARMGVSDLVLAETGGMAVNTLGYVRDQTATGDEVLTQLVNKVLRRRGDRARLDPVSRQPDGRKRRRPVIEPVPEPVPEAIGEASDEAGGDPPLSLPAGPAGQRHG